MNNKYLELKRRHVKEVNDFPFIFAFSQEQLNEGMKKLGLNATDTDKILSIGYGGYIRKSDKENFFSLNERQEKELKDAIQNDTTGENFIYDMFDYELSNHEYCITMDVSDTLDALGLTIDEVNNNPNLLKGLQKAIKNQKLLK